MIAVNTLGCILVGFLWLYYTLNCRILVGSTSFIGDSLEVLQPFLHLSKKECIFFLHGEHITGFLYIFLQNMLGMFAAGAAFGWARCCFKDDRGSFVRGDGSEYQYVFSYCDGFGSCRIDLFLGDVPNGIFLLHSAWTLLPFLLMPLILPLVIFLRNRFLLR